MKADVYHNLHTGLWSIKDRRTGLVVRHARVVASAQPCGFAVQPAGRAKVLATGQKNVHAFVRRAWLAPYDDLVAWQRLTETVNLVPVSYNPFRGDSFYRKDTGQSVTEVKSIVMIAPPDARPYVGAII